MNLKNDRILTFSDFISVAFYWMNDIYSGPDWHGGSDSNHRDRVDSVDILKFVYYLLWCRAGLDLDGAVNFTDYDISPNGWMNQYYGESYWCKVADLYKIG